MTDSWVHKILFDGKEKARFLNILLIQTRGGQNLKNSFSYLQQYGHHASVKALSTLALDNMTHGEPWAAKMDAHGFFSTEQTTLLITGSTATAIENVHASLTGHGGLFAEVIKKSMVAFFMFAVSIAIPVGFALNKQIFNDWFGNTEQAADIEILAIGSFFLETGPWIIGAILAFTWIYQQLNKRLFEPEPRHQLKMFNIDDARFTVSICQFIYFGLKQDLSISHSIRSAQNIYTGEFAQERLQRVVDAQRSLTSLNALEDTIFNKAHFQALKAYAPNDSPEVLESAFKNTQLLIEEELTTTFVKMRRLILLLAVVSLITTMILTLQMITALVLSH